MARALTPRGPRLWWLPAAASALLLSPFLEGLSRYLLGDEFWVGAIVGMALAGAVAWLLARRFRGPRWGARLLALVAAGVALASGLALLSGAR